MFLFDLATILPGVLSNYSGLLACRFFPELFDAEIFPECKGSMTQMRHRFRIADVES